MLNRSNRLAIGIGILLLVVAFGPAIYLWDANRNRGFTWGYYAEFNTISNSLAQIPGVTITDTYLLDDFQLELFTFDLVFNGKPIHLRFPQDDPARILTNEGLLSALTTRLIEEQKTIR